MAKRIKVKGNPPRGLSKRERQDIHHFTNRGSLGGFNGKRDLMYTVKRVNPDGTVEPHTSPFADKNPMSRPSSTRKKLVKEGSRKFVGPRQLRGELAEHRDAEGGPEQKADWQRRGVKKLPAVERIDPGFSETGNFGAAPLMSPAVIRKLLEYLRSRRDRRALEGFSESDLPF